MPSEPVTVIVPAYNEQQSIDDTLSDLIRTMQNHGESPFEILVVDDGSTDGSGDVVAARADHCVRLLRHDSNLGYGASLKTGIRHAKHDLIVIVDADGTYPIARIPDLLTVAAECDMVVGARTGVNVQYSRLRTIPKWFLVSFAQWVSRRRIPDLNSGMRVFRKSIVQRFLKILPDGFSFTTTITIALLANHFRVHYEPIDYHARVGQSKIQPIRDTLRFLNLILRTGAYFAPLRVFLPIASAFFIGFLFSLALDVINNNLHERTLLLLIASTQLGMFSLLADMIDKRTA